MVAGAVSDRILQDLHLLLHARFGIDYTTIQVETEAPPFAQIAPASRAQ